MSQSSIPVRIFDRHKAETVDALLYIGLTEEQIYATQGEWESLRKSSIARLLEQGIPKENLPKHWGWDWTRKISRLSDKLIGFYGIECEGKMQGMIEVEKERHFAKLPSQKNQSLVYVTYLETAPWNNLILEPKPRFAGVGARLMLAAVDLSLEEDCKGRVGLHSLPGKNKGEPEWFYQEICWMEPIESERNWEGLLYFELTPENADKFLSGEKRK